MLDAVDVLDGCRMTLGDISLFQVITTMDEWYKRYKELLDFRDRNGHIDVPNKVHSDGQYSDGLGEWLCQQRSLLCEQPDNCHSNGDRESNPDQSSEQKAALLQALNFDCVPSNQNDPQPCAQKELTKVEDNQQLGINGDQQQEQASATVSQEAAPTHGLMDIADAYTIRAVMHSHERKRAHNELMHSSLKALFAEKIRTGILFDENALDENNENDGSSSNNPRQK